MINCNGKIALDNADISMKCDRFVQNTQDLSQALLFWPFLAAQIPLDNVGHIGGGLAKFHSAPVSGCSLCRDVCPLQKRRLQCKILEITGAEKRSRQIASRLRIQLARMCVDLAQYCTRGTERRISLRRKNSFTADLPGLPGGNKRRSTMNKSNRETITSSFL